MTERLTLLLHTLLCPQVSNQGQSLNTLGSAFLNIMWPHEIANGKWLLYPMRVELEGGQGPGQSRNHRTPGGGGVPTYP